LSADEAALAESLTGRPLRHEAQPPWVRCEAPEWLYPRFVEAFGAGAEAELLALIPPAPVDLRVNILNADRAGALAVLAEDGLEAEPTPISPWGLRLPGRRALGEARAYRRGLVEVQDEGSQAVALLVGAGPGMTVVDFCAGAGGKTLALAVAMGGEGRLVAHDTEPRRLAEAERRLARAGALNVELCPAGDPEMAGLTARCDRVLVDVPCSGSGVWRRQPDARWRLTPERLAGHVEAQAAILDAAAPLVAPGGRLAYATCSLLPEENEAQVARFLERWRDFAAMPPEPLWAAALGGPCPGYGEAVLLSPARGGTDGFFCAVLERRGAP
jgi:16S rRNA (cytosine967-C5)-methyltransferase